MKTEFIDRLIENFPQLSVCRGEIVSALEAVLACYDAGGKILCCGNGGSSADCDHFAGELMKGFLKKRPLSESEKQRFENRALADSLQKGLPVISLTANTAVTSAIINDCPPECVFAQQVYALAKEEDLLIVFSTSGNSENIVLALEAARAAGIKSVAITGIDGGRCAGKADICIKLPARETYRVQELTLPVYHCLAAAAEAEYFEI